MKKMILGVGLFVCGVVLLCTEYAVQRIMASMPNTTLVPGGIPISYAAYAVMAAGAALTAYSGGQRRHRGLHPDRRQL